MLSITDLLDFIDLDPETVRIVGRATGLGDDDSVALARQLLASEDGIALIHHMYRDHPDIRQDATMDRDYHRFARKYPLPGAFPQP
ncbi:MAG: hypothetical protein KDG52_01580 [Rhodocyclaceae bacterium]|nr:hypothetical protein [Rhodocyclaceae bacterium]